MIHAISRPWPYIQRGTDSSTDAVQITRVPPQLISDFAIPESLLVARIASHEMLDDMTLGAQRVDERGANETRATGNQPFHLCCNSQS